MEKAAFIINLLMFVVAIIQMLISYLSYRRKE